MYEHESFFNSDYEEQTYQAERELNGFIKAVRELFGPELARTATEDWLEESELTDSPRDRPAEIGVRLPSQRRLDWRVGLMPHKIVRDLSPPKSIWRHSATPRADRSVCFPQLDNIGKLILIVNVHPSVGVNPSAPTTDEPFAVTASKAG